jgi:REP element-mobilizing transposase RayT
LLPTQAISRHPAGAGYFLKILEQVRRRHVFRLIGFVLMPEHVHLLISEPEKGNTSVVLQVLKQKVSRALRKKPRGTLLPCVIPLRIAWIPSRAGVAWGEKVLGSSVLMWYSLYAFDALVSPLEREESGREVTLAAFFYVRPKTARLCEGLGKAPDSSI